jgi:urease accessory protein
MKSLLLLIAVDLLASKSPPAHGFVGSGWLHPLTGIDHMLAMIAVGAWSAQLGKRAVFYVPAAFVAAMLFGGVLGFERFALAGNELGIALSVVMLGSAIALERRIPLFLAAIGVGLFGISHGYAHGYEIPGMESTWAYALGFLITTACLHLIGAVGGILILEHARGSRWLRFAGAMTATIGLYLLMR